MKARLSRFRRPLAAVAVALAAISRPAQAILELDNFAPPTPTVDYRVGELAPGAAQLNLVQSLGAEANWNRFGTVHSMVKHGGFIAQGFGGTPVEGARAFVMANRALFKLSEQGVNDLELVNDGITPNNPGHAVLFRQRFGGLSVTHDGLVTVGIVDGKVYYVSSSSAGDQAPPGAVKLSPLDAWLVAAKDVQRGVPLSSVLGNSYSDKLGWNIISVKGFAQPQRVRLSAIPMPSGGVRQAYETIVLNSSGADVIAYVHFIDAETGKVLLRENRVNWQSQPTVASYQGVLPDAKTCGPFHDFTVPASQAQIAVVAAAAVETNDIVLNLYFAGAVVATSDQATSPEAITYAPAGGVLPGLYRVQVCPFVGSVAGAANPPFNYVGTFAYSDTAGPSTAITLPSWKWFTAFPLPDYSGTENRTKACWTKTSADCQLDVQNIASRLPWDVTQTNNTSTMTTIGNNATTAEAWGSPLTPAEMYRPVSSNRSYIFPFANKWNKSKCDPTNLVPQGNDIDAAVTQLFVVHNRMHDFSYYLGFTELNSNLQTSNFGNTGTTRENDAEVGNVQAGALSGSPTSPTFYTAPGRDNANQIALQDGVPGITNQYLFQSLGGSLYSPCADGDLDMSVVGHEYTHAISNRMIGGPDQSIGGQQGGSMGESWSDLDATEYLMAYNYIPVKGESPTAIGAYATGNKVAGIRDFPLDANPLNYSNLGFDTPGAEVHSDGEIWNAVNWDIRTALVAKYNSTWPASDKVRQKDCADGKYAADDCPGNRRWIQIIFDSFLLMPAAPSMLDARDAMLAADVARFNSANQKELWHAFAKRGMGKDAYSADGADTAPVGNFESPLESFANVTFKVLAGDEAGTPITTAKIYLGQYSARTRPIADTDPATVVDSSTAAKRRATLNKQNSAHIVPGTYDFVVGAPGYGLQRFKATLAAGDSSLTFTLPTNYASITKGASVVTTATVQANIDAKNTLIDDSEETGARIGDANLVKGAYAIVKLAGGAHSVSNINLSTAAGPNNAGRFTGIRKFEVLTCNGTCAAATDFTKVAYTSPDDAFPGVLIRPVQPDLIFRNFEFPPQMATHVMVRVLTSQCTGQPLYAGDQDSDPTVNADCPSYQPPAVAGVNATAGTVTTPTPPASVVRATDIQVFGSKAGTNAAVPTSATAGGTSGNGVVSLNSTTSNASMTASNDGGRFGGGALGAGLLLPLLLAAGRRRTKA
jgi:hypothetical protein